MSFEDILEKYIEAFEALSGSVSGFAEGLRRLGYRVCVFEDLDVEGGGNKGKPLKYKRIKLKELLDELVRLNPAYTWAKINKNIINIFPVNSILDEKLPPIDVKEKNLKKILIEYLRLEDKGIFLFEELRQAGGPLIELHLKEYSVRDALNRVINGFERTVWHVSGRPGAYFLTFTDVPQGGTIIHYDRRS